MEAGFTAFVLFEGEVAAPEEVSWRAASSICLTLISLLSPFYKGIAVFPHPGCRQAHGHEP